MVDDLPEEVDGLNTEILRKDPLDNVDIVCMAFHEDRAKQFSIFKSDFDLNLSMISQESVKEAVEKPNLGGVFFTPDLGNPF
ncbi:MAG: hypothetical protein V4732_16435 [Pseudomonadota bacterium]